MEKPEGDEQERKEGEKERMWRGEGDCIYFFEFCRNEYLRIKKIEPLGFCDAVAVGSAFSSFYYRWEPEMPKVEFSSLKV